MLHWGISHEVHVSPVQALLRNRHLPSAPPFVPKRSKPNADDHQLGKWRMRARREIGFGGPWLEGDSTICLCLRCIRISPRWPVSKEKHTLGHAGRGNTQQSRISAEERNHWAGQNKILLPEKGRTLGCVPWVLLNRISLVDAVSRIGSRLQLAIHVKDDKQLEDVQCNVNPSESPVVRLATRKLMLIFEQ